MECPGLGTTLPWGRVTAGLDRRLSSQLREGMKNLNRGVT